MRKRLTVDQRGRIAEKVMEWGNLVFIGLVISQVISGPPFKLIPAMAGVVGIVLAYVAGIKFMKKGGGK